MTPDKIKNLGAKKVILDRFEGGSAVFKFEDGQELKWEKENLPRNFKVGDEIVFKLATFDSEIKEREEIARKLLEEILNKAK